MKCALLLCSYIGNCITLRNFGKVYLYMNSSEKSVLSGLGFRAFPGCMPISLVCMGGHSSHNREPLLRSMHCWEHFLFVWPSWHALSENPGVEEGCIALHACG